MAASAIVALCLLALASAAPQTMDIQCSTSCNPSPKFSYAPGVTYAYQYTGRQTISIEGVEDGSANAEWSANVALTWVTPCDLAISVQNFVGSNIPEIQESQLEKYPLVLAVNNGVVESACSHPEDDASSINVKKAIASALQNTLPSIAPTSETQIITETDVFGKCPTKYAITTEGTKTVVTKKKNHSECQEHFYKQTQISILPSETPLPMHDSQSRCRQEITNGIYSTIACKDTKVITPGYGIFKNLMAIQDFTLQFISESTDISAISNQQGVALRSQTLKYEHGVPIKNPAIVPRVDAIMPEICTVSRGQSNKDVASLVAQAIELFHFVPDDAVVEVLDKIRAGQYCDDYTKLESLFLDAVAFVGEPGAFNVMAQEIAAGRTTGGRLSLYTVAVNLLTQPTLNHVAALTPIFGMEDSNQLLNLAASTLVNRYCTQNVDCDQTTPVKEILNLLSTKLNTQCTPDFSNVEATQVLTTLKSVGNIGKVNKVLFDAVMKCALSEEIETNVRFAATMSLKGVTCLEPVTKGLKSVSLDPTMNTEVRIGSYLAAVRCANAADLQEVIDQMSSESNMQVRGFILSHLANLKETNWPLKQTLQRIMSTKNVPSYYMYIKNIFKYSRNIEMSYNVPIVEVGGLVESNIVYTPESFVPRLVNLGLNMNLLGSFLNIGEVGARIEGLDPYFEDALGPNSYLYKEVFGPNSYLYKTPIWTIVEDSKLFVTKTGTELIQVFKDVIKEETINIDAIVKALNKLMKMNKNINVDYLTNTLKQLLKEYKNIDVQALIQSIDFDAIAKAAVKFLKTKNIQLPMTDLYAIIRGQERAFISFGGQQNEFTVNELVETITPVIMDVILGVKSINIDTTRTGQINFDYSLPTISGIPLKVKLGGTAVAGIKINNNINAKKSTIDAVLKIIPSLNAQVEVQIGFGELLSTGLKFRNSVYTTNEVSFSVVQKNSEDLELQLELPEKMDFFDIQSEVFLMNLDKASNEVKLFPSQMQDVRIITNHCSGLIAPVIGLLVCYNINVPDLINSDSLPLGQPMAFRVYFQKSDVAMKGYKLAAKLKNNPEKKLLKIDAGTYGASNSKESTLKFSYIKEENTHLMAINIQSSVIKSTTEITFINLPDYLSLQIYGNDKFSTFAPVEGSVKVEFTPVTVSNGNTYEVATYAGLTKSLNQKHRLFQMMLSILESGDMITTNFITKTDLFPAIFEVEVGIPKNAGLRIYKVEKVTVSYRVSSVVVEGRFLKKSPEVFQTTILVLNSESPLISIDAVHTISIDSPIFGGTANKVNLMTSVNGKIPIAEFGFASKLNYENGVMVLVIGDSEVFEFNSKLTYNNIELESSSGIKYYNSEVVLVNSKISYDNGAVELTCVATYFGANVFSAKLRQTSDIKNLIFMAEITIPSVFYMDLQQTIDNTALTTVAQIDIPALEQFKPLKINYVLGMNSAFSWRENRIDISIIADVNRAGSVLLHIEGPLSFVISTKLIQQNIDLKISGAYDGNFKIMHGIILSRGAYQFLGLKEMTVKSIVNLPFIIESDMATVINTSVVHSTMNTRVLPRTPYARRFKGYADFNWVENYFKGDIYWDAERDNNKKIGVITMYALDTTALKLITKCDLIVSTFTYGYKLEFSLASPFEWFQGRSGIKFTATMPSKKIAIVNSMIDIQYTESQVALNPMIAFITTNENKYELATSVVMKKLPTFLNFVITSETTFSSPQMNQITLVTSLLHADKDQSGKIAYKMSLGESVLSEAISFEYILQFETSEFSRIVRVIKGFKGASLSTLIHIESGVKAFEITNELSLPFTGLKSLTTKLIRTSEGMTSLAVINNQKMIVNVYHIMQSFTSHIVGIEIPSRTLEFSAVFDRNQVTLKIFPEKNKNAKVVETKLRFIEKAATGQFEVLVTAPSLTKEMRLAVEMELIEPGKDQYDIISIDVQYQVSDAPKLLKATLNEMKNIYVDLVNDGMCPDLNKWYMEVKKVFNQIPTELLRYWNIVKTEAPILFKKYIDILKKTETWKSVQNTLSELLVNYPAYYDASVDFYNKVVITYVAELADMVGKILALPELDIYQIRDLLKTEVMMFINNLMENMSTTDLVNIVKSKFSELVASYPEEYQAVLRIYNQVSQIKLGNIIATVKSYINEELDITYSISAEKFTAIVPLPVSAATLRNCYHIITVYAPAFVADVVAQWFALGRALYKYIEARIPVIAGCINTQAQIYLQYTKNYLKTMKVKSLQAYLDKYDEYVKELIRIVEPYFWFAWDSAYGQMVAKNVVETVLLLETKFPRVYRAVSDSLTLLIMNAVDSGIFAFQCIYASAPVQKAFEYIGTRRKTQATLESIMECVISTMNQIEAKVNGLIVSIPKEIPPFIEMHIPAFIISFISSIVSYLK